MKIREDIEKSLPKHNFHPRVHSYIIVVQNPELFIGTDIAEYVKKSWATFDLTVKAVYYIRPQERVRRSPNINDYPSMRNCSDYDEFIEITI